MWWKKMLICVRTSVFTTDSFDWKSISNCIKAKKCHSINFTGSDGTFCCTSCWVITREKAMKKNAVHENTVILFNRGVINIFHFAFIRLQVRQCERVMNDEGIRTLCVGSKSTSAIFISMTDTRYVTRDDDYTVDNHRFNAIHTCAEQKKQRWTANSDQPEPGRCKNKAKKIFNVNCIYKLIKVKRDQLKRNENKNWNLHY